MKYIFKTTRLTEKNSKQLKRFMKKLNPKGTFPVTPEYVIINEAIASYIKERT